MIVLTANQMEKVKYARVASLAEEILNEEFAECGIAIKSYEQLLKLIHHVAPRVATYEEVTERFLLKFSLTAVLLGDDFDLDDPRVSEQLLRSDLTRGQKEELLENYLVWNIKQVESKNRAN